MLKNGGPSRIGIEFASFSSSSLKKLKALARIIYMLIGTFVLFWYCTHCVRNFFIFSTVADLVCEYCVEEVAEAAKTSTNFVIIGPNCAGCTLLQAHSVDNN